MTVAKTCSHAMGILTSLSTIATVGLLAALADEPPEEDFPAFRRKEMTEIETKLEAIPAGAASDQYVSAARSAAEDTEALVDEVMEYFGRVRSHAVGSMVSETIGVSSSRPSRAVAISHADQVRDVYIKYHERLARDVAAVSADAPEAALASQHIDATLAAAKRFILIQATEIEALGQGAAAAEWAILVPLLRNGDATWNKEMPASLPEWMKRTQSLHAAEYVCLAAARPRAAYHLWAYHVSGDQEEAPGLGIYLANLHRRANACFGSKDFLKGLAILKATIVLADAEGMADEAVKSRFRLAEVYTMYGHSRLAAEEMKLAATAYPDHKEHGRAVLMRLKYLYDTGDYDEIVQETPALLEDNAAADFRPQIIYIAWVASLRLNKPEAADELQRVLLRDYPDSPLCADVYFSSAMNLLAANDYSAAARMLEMIADRYANTPIAAKSREILERLKAVR
jgi:tetratricopeptide (TPR) repeat protein